MPSMKPFPLPMTLFTCWVGTTRRLTVKFWFLPLRLACIQINRWPDISYQQSLAGILGLNYNPVAKSMTGQLDPERFWEAWMRGSELTVDTFAPGWNIWGIAQEPLENVRRHYNVPPLAS